MGLLGLRSAWIQEPTSKAKEGYSKCKEIVQRARKSILVLSHYSPPVNPIRFPESRSSYLFDGIEEAVRISLRSKGSHFLYRRLIQCDHFLAKGEALDSESLGDQQLLEHCSRMLGLVKDNPDANTQVDIRICERKPSFPSMLLVDDRYAIFALPSKDAKQSIGKDLYSLNGIFFLEDSEGGTVKGFQTMYRRFSQDSQRVAFVKIDQPESADIRKED